jgi:hypothetical protein
MTVSTVGRLGDHSTLIQIDGKSYRRRRTRHVRGPCQELICQADRASMTRLRRRHREASSGGSSNPWRPCSTRARSTGDRLALTRLQRCKIRRASE